MCSGTQLCPKLHGCVVKVKYKHTKQASLMNKVVSWEPKNFENHRYRKTEIVIPVFLTEIYLGVIIRHFKMV